MDNIDKFDIKKIKEDLYYVNLIQKQDERIVSNGLSFTKSELFELYLKLRDIFSN